MSSSDAWGLFLALLAIVLPLWLAWLLLAWGDRKRNPRSASKARRPR
jgi:hypothetical protein